MTKSEIKDLLTKFLESIPDDVETVENTVETDSTGETETVETVENTVDTETTGETETETVLSTETTTRIETVTENGERKMEEKRIYVDSSGEYYYR